MKHFMVEITYLFPEDIITQTTPEHRAFLKAGYDCGLLLLSGPMVPRVGGIVVARAETLEAVQAFFRSDPYQLKDLASYRYVEFNPVFFQPFLEPWIKS
jgi:uncharacterized protein YciI